VNSHNIYELLKLKLTTPPNIDWGDVSDTDTVAIRGNRKIRYWSKSNRVLSIPLHPLPLLSDLSNWK